MEGINIYSKSNDSLGRTLTNPSYAKNGKSEFDIFPILNQQLISPDKFLLPYTRQFEWAIHRFGKNVTAKDCWGFSVESWFFANTKNKDGKDLLNQKEKEELMFHLIVCKLDSYPDLINQIDKRGGIEWLSKCSHIVSGNKNWEGVGEKNNFIKVLCRAYRHIKSIEQPKEIKQIELL